MLEILCLQNEVGVVDVEREVVVAEDVINSSREEDGVTKDKEGLTGSRTKALPMVHNSTIPRRKPSLAINILPVPITKVVASSKVATSKEVGLTTKGEGAISKGVEPINQEVELTNKEVVLINKGVEVTSKGVEDTSKGVEPTIKVKEGVGFKEEVNGEEGEEEAGVEGVGTIEVLLISNRSELLRHCIYRNPGS